VEVGASEVDLTPFEINGLGNAEAVPRHQQDQRAIAVTVTTVFGGLNQPREFGLGEVLAAIAAPHCPVPPLTFHKSPFGDNPSRCHLAAISRRGPIVTFYTILQLWKVR
jgi:hypothetical protein